MKRNCRRTDDERDQHDRATRIRKMTDAQICSYIDGLEQKAAAVAAAPKKTEDAIRHFVDSLAVRTDSGNRISDATIRKIRQMAYEMGFLTEEGGDLYGTTDQAKGPRWERAHALFPLLYGRLAYLKKEQRGMLGAGYV